MDLVFPVPKPLAGSPSALLRKLLICLILFTQNIFISLNLKTSEMLKIHIKQWGKEASKVGHATVDIWRLVIFPS